ncbi:hypothetical protein SEA_FRANSOYER_9 [Microbacterium phage Fransoyer]|nr:hypothetical protein SEA_FRANSOYER_9 [Microbacterium phage Fransoyer]
MSRPGYEDSIASENRDIDDIVYRGSVPPTVGPRGAAGDSGARSLAEEVRAEAGTFAPRRVGPMAQSVREAHLVVTSPVRGIHALLCRLGLHAWQARYEGTSYTMHRLRARCAVCGVRR